MKALYEISAVANAGPLAQGNEIPALWDNYFSTQVMPIMNGLRHKAAEADRTVLEDVYEQLKSTRNQNADAVGIVLDLWPIYNTVYRPRLQNIQIQTTLDQVLYRSFRYVKFINQK